MEIEDNSPLSSLHTHSLSLFTKPPLAVVAGMGANGKMVENFNDIIKDIPKQEMEGLIDEFLNGGGRLHFDENDLRRWESSLHPNAEATGTPSLANQVRRRRGRPRKPPGAPKAPYNNTNRAASAKAKKEVAIEAVYTRKS